MTAAGLALRYEPRAIAVLGILGGFAAPLLLAEGLPDQRILLAYVLLLDLGVLALATFRNWRWLTLLGLLGSLLLFGFWQGWFGSLFGFWQGELSPGLLLSQIALTIIFLIFVGATTLFHLLWRRPPGAVDQGLMTLNAAAYYGISYGLLRADWRDWMGGFYPAAGGLLRPARLRHNPTASGADKAQPFCRGHCPGLADPSRAGAVGWPLDQRGLGRRGGGAGVAVFPAGYAAAALVRDGLAGPADGAAAAAPHHPPGFPGNLPIPAQ